MSIETMTKLQTVTVGAGGASTISFTNIPQNYSDLVVRLSLRESAGGSIYDDIQLQINSTTSALSSRMIYSTGNTSTAVYTASYTGQTKIWVGGLNDSGSTTSVFGSAELYISNYSGNTYKILSSESITENNGTNNLMVINSILYSSPEPVTSLTFNALNGNLAQYSTATLYGIKNAAKTAGNSIKATGGNIVFDGTYVYHMFDSTGSFTPTQPLNLTVLSVGAGGGGGWNNAGGGGGGEVDIASNISVPAGISNIVTIGSGGVTASSTASAGGNGTPTSFGSYVSSLGGGGGGTGDGPGAQIGGSGGGGALSNGGAAGSGSNTNAGGTGFAVGSGPERYAGGGGGGATSVGGDANTTTRVSGAGGQGYALSNIFAGFNLGNITHFGSGGSGGIYVNGSTGTVGLPGSNAGTGGQQSTSGNINPINATANAGGGGGGGSYTGVNSRQGSNGGSGIVIVRYKG